MTYPNEDRVEPTFHKSGGVATTCEDNLSPVSRIVSCTQTHYDQLVAEELINNETLYIIVG
jgi:hypothetical protein